MQEIDAYQLKNIIKHVVLKLDEPIMVIGPSGAGKTAVIDEAGEEEDCFVHHVLLGQYDTVDLKGTPWVSDSEGYQSTVWHSASTLPFEGNPAFPTDRPILLFLDELTSATVPVMGVCYQLINERRVGEHKLMPNVRIACAGNREIDKGIVNRFPMPLSNRLTWYEYAIKVDPWCHVMQREYGSKAAIFVAFLQWKKTYIHTWDPAKPEKVFASPRTIEKTIRYFNDDMPTDIKMASIAGAVGNGWAHEFWAFHDHWQKITGLMKAIKKDPDKAPLPEEESLKYAISVSISGDFKPENAASLHKYLIRLDPEYVALAWSLAVKRDSKMFSSDQFIDFTRRYKSVVQ